MAWLELVVGDPVRRASTHVLEQPVTREAQRRCRAEACEVAKPRVETEGHAERAFPERLCEGRGDPPKLFNARRDRVLLQGRFSHAKTSCGQRVRV